jgi:hypothetical protein
VRPTNDRGSNLRPRDSDIMLEDPTLSIQLYHSCDIEGTRRPFIRFQQLDPVADIAGAISTWKYKTQYSSKDMENWSFCLFSYNNNMEYITYIRDSMIH